MTAPKYDGRISLGNIIQLVMIVVAAAIGWTRFEAGIEANRRDIARVSASVEATAELAQDTRVSVTRQDERLTGIYTLLNRIDSRLARIEQRTPN